MLLGKLITIGMIPWGWLGRKLSTQTFGYRTHTHSEDSNHITKTCLYNFDPLKPHFYIVKLGFTGVYIIFLFLLKNINCGYSLEPPCLTSTTIYVLSRIWKNIRAFIWKFSVFWRWNFLYIWIGVISWWDFWSESPLGVIWIAKNAKSLQDDLV